MQTAETPRALKEIRELLDGGDAASVEHAAHRLVGSLIVFGADDAVIAARSLEQCSREGRLAEARTELPRLEYELQRFLAALDRVLQTPHT
jgi:HPt (histidine-containing phosphotransfer) domain-containing protein